MEIICIPASFNRWEAKFIVDGEVYGHAIGQRPGCAIRDAINEFCLKYEGMPNSSVRLVVEEWD